MVTEKTKHILLRTSIILVIFWGLLWLYYHVALSLNYFGSAADSDVHLIPGHIAKTLQDDMERYRSVHGYYPNIGEKCQDILVLKPYFSGSITTGKYPKDFYGYQWFLTFLYPEKNILLHPQPLWKFSVSVKEDGSAYVIRAEDRNNHLSGIMRIVAHYVVGADFSNKDILSLSWESPSFPKKDSILSGSVLGCDCTGLNYCVGNKNMVQF